DGLCSVAVGQSRVLGDRVDDVGLVHGSLLSGEIRQGEAGRGKVAEPRNFLRSAKAYRSLRTESRRTGAPKTSGRCGFRAWSVRASRRLAARVEGAPLGQELGGVVSRVLAHDGRGGPAPEELEVGLLAAGAA